MKQFSSFFWLVPFFCFSAGYYMLSRFMHVEQVAAPQVVGLLLQDALKSMAAVHLQGQIVAEKEEPDLPEGLVLDQTPVPGQHIKVTQPIFLTVTKKPLPLKAPHYVGLQKAEIEAQARTQAARPKFHELESNYPIGFCFGQSPAAGEPLTESTVDVYISGGMTTTRIFPAFKGKSVAEVQEFCTQFGIKVQVFHEERGSTEHVCKTCRVKDQKPIAGTLFDLKKPLVVQVIAE